MGYVRAILALALVLGSLPVRAEVFRWVDGEGTVHLTDNASTVPESKMDGVKVYASHKSAPPATTGKEGERSQVRFASLIATELGLSSSPAQDPVSLLNAYGIYPRAGWNPTGRLGLRAAREVAAAAELAASSHRLEQLPSEAREAVLQAARTLGLEVSRPQPPAPEPVPAAEVQPLIVSPQVVVEAPAPIIIHAPQPILPNPTFLFGVPFAPAPGFVAAPTSRARRVANSFQVTRTTPLAPFRQRVRRGGFGTLATTPLESMFAK